MVRSCSAYGCRERATKGSQVNFFRFPFGNRKKMARQRRDSEREREIWQRQMREERRLIRQQFMNEGEEEDTKAKTEKNYKTDNFWRRLKQKRRKKWKNSGIESNIS
jgi:hypothetical protein